MRNVSYKINIDRPVRAELGGKFLFLLIYGGISLHTVELRRPPASPMKEHLETDFTRLVAREIDKTSYRFQVLFLKLWLCCIVPFLFGFNEFWNHFF